MESQLIKPLTSAVFAAALDYYVLAPQFRKTPNVNHALMFGAEVGVGVFAGKMVGQYAPDFNAGMLGSGKAVESRIIEVTLATALSGMMEKASNNTLKSNEFAYKVVSIALADVIGEYADDYFHSRPLTLFR